MPPWTNPTGTSTVSGPRVCSALMFTDTATEHECGPFEASPPRGSRYVVLQQWQYTARSLLPGGEARGREFTW